MPDPGPADPSPISHHLNERNVYPVKNDELVNAWKSSTSPGIDAGHPVGDIVLGTGDGPGARSRLLRRGRADAVASDTCPWPTMTVPM